MAVLFAWARTAHRAQRAAHAVLDLVDGKATRKGVGLALPVLRPPPTRPEDRVETIEA